MITDGITIDEMISDVTMIEEMMATEMTSIDISIQEDVHEVHKEGILQNIAVEIIHHEDVQDPEIEIVGKKEITPLKKITKNANRQAQVMRSDIRNLKIRKNLQKDLVIEVEAAVVAAAAALSQIIKGKNDKFFSNCIFFY